MALLHNIISDKEQEVAASRKELNIGDLRRMISDTPPIRSFSGALAADFGLIAEIKKKSPSGREMRSQNVEQAIDTYKRSRLVKAISVLTDSKYFGMKKEDLLKVKEQVSQPILRKDFILNEYQIYESRALGADAILLMANVLHKKEKMRRLFELASELGMDVLFESHTEREIHSIPEGAKIYGINSRKLMGGKSYRISRLIAKYNPFWRLGLTPDFSTDLSTFNLIKYLPTDVLKVAESGVKPNKVAEIRNLGFNSVLVGTSLLKAESGIQSMLSDFEEALRPAEIVNRVPHPVPS